jgi:hypothetical protein
MPEFKVEYIELGDRRGKYDAVRRLLTEEDGDVISLSFAGIEAALGFTLPASARRYPAWWSNDVSHSQAKAWMDAGWRTGQVSLADERVSFSRVASASVRPQGTRSTPGARSTVAKSYSPSTSPRPRAARRTPEERKGRVGLVGCVKTKRSEATPAAELYLSPLFAGRRAYVEDSCERWYVLSAEYGLVAPDERIEPYEKALKGQPKAAKEFWSRQVFSRIRQQLGSLQGLTFEIHAGKDYFAFGLRDALRKAGARVEIPTEHLKQGEQRAFYNSAAEEAIDSVTGPSLLEDSGSTPAIDVPRHQERDVRTALNDLDAAPTLVPARDWPAGVAIVDEPGLYAWWVDRAGSADLSRGLGLVIDTDRIYVGLAGATWWPSGKTTDHTLGRRIGQMHLGGKVRMSTFRWTLAALLFDQLDMYVQAPMLITPASEQALSEWMYRHLSVAVHPHEDRDTLASLEESVLERLDPPLNLKHMPPTPVRRRLTELRRRISREP